MTKQDLKDWITLNNQYQNGYHLSDHDKRELVRLNHLLMKICHEIHNKSMLGNL